MRLKQTENEVKADIEEYMAIAHIIGWRQNSGAYAAGYQDKKGNEKSRFFRFIRWIWPKDQNLVFLDYAGMINGKYWTCEVKATGKKPTEEQEYTIDWWNNRGCFAFWADSREIFIQKWEKYEKQIR